MTTHLPYRDPALPVTQRVNDLINRMTREEKVGQMMQQDARNNLDHLINEVHIGSILHASPEALREAHELTERTRLAIPLLVGEDCIHGHSFFEGTTIFPTQLGMAASWNAPLIEQAARVTAIEASATGIHWTFSPVLCISRDLRWGRVNETFGEDPHLIGELASAMVRGYQGDGLTDNTAILATAKHFAAYSETQGGRDASEADISQRKMRSWFLPPFERVAREGCRTFMLGYQTTDGIPITINSWLLGDVLRGEWDYTGMLVTDWDNVGRMVWEQQVMPDYTHAAAAAVKAGNDMVMTTPQFFDGALTALNQGLLVDADIDAAVARILTVKFELGLFDNPRHPDLERIATALATPEHTAINRDLTRRSLVLLANDGTLPLTATTEGSKKIAVIGPNANDHQYQLGDWAGNSGQAGWMPNGHRTDQITTVYEGLRDIVPDTWTITHARGANIVDLVDDPAGTHFPDGQPRPRIAQPAPIDNTLHTEALTAAKDADYIVAVVGDAIPLVGEGRSTATLNLLGGQEHLLNELAATGKPLIVVLLASKPLVLPPSALGANAIIWAANPGMRGGQALAELITGAIEPAGRLPISFARHVGQQPTYYNQIRGQHGDRYADLTQDPQWAFGFGLSYTSVEYSGLTLDRDQLGEGDTVTAHITLTNTGQRPAVETVQAYVSDLVTSASWADKELKAFTQVEVQPGQSVTATVQVPVADCTIVDARGCRVVEPGEFELLVGPSSRASDLHRVRFTVQ
ncbi:glycoside hydrolase family 3 N-terminal domain-containing protein [Jonesia quinghaiensis]|uniref:exo-beta-d-1,3/1,6-glucosidase n=1 Tax=Jonesia quinghaiensis TaxID=262806 RepID=UPI000419432D|nr:glycoside hydrolase family 3 N-terminal domain-containing protein [Jonesia quinghaiensis]